MSFIDFLPQEIKNIIISKIVPTTYGAEISYEDFEEILSIFTMKKDVDFDNILRLGLRNLYNVTIDEILTESIPLKDALYNLFMDEFKFANMILGRNNFKERFLGLYERVKNFNLNSVGSQNMKNNYGNKSLHVRNAWKDFLYRINNILPNDFLTESVLKFRDTGKIPDNYI